jgi:hypothetical protein
VLVSVGLLRVVNLFVLELRAAEEQAAGRPVRLTGEQLHMLDEQSARLGWLLEKVRGW